MSEPVLNELALQPSQGDGLLIVPPGAKLDSPSLAAHLLQAGCLREGINVQIFYANLHFSSFIGYDIYHIIVESNAINFMVERLFTASAFGLPPLGRNIYRLIDPDWLPDHRWQRKNKVASGKMLEHLAPIRRRILSVNWQHVEKQATQWTKSVAKQIARLRYPVVGCTNTLGGLVPGIALLNQVKQRNPNIITVLGGALCEGEMAEGILSLETGIDYVFSGEGDITFPAFLRDILGGKRPKEKIISSKEVVNLDEIPVSDYQEYFRQAKDFSLKLSYKDSFFIPYETSRGCWWRKCTFCAMKGARKSYRVKSPDKAFQDLEQLVHQHPTIPVLMTDTLMPQQYLNTLFPRLSYAFPPIDIRYGASANLTLEQVIALKQAGVTLVFAGIESLSPSLLGRIRKNTTVRQNIALLRYARSVGIVLWWNILFGIPGDQVCEYEEMLKLIPLIHHLPPPDRVIPIEITRLSLYQTTPGEFEISNLRPAELYKDVLPANVNLEKIAFYFTGDFRAKSYEHPDILARLREEYQAWLKEWKPYKTKPTNAQPPTLYIERKSPSHFVLKDTRGLPGIPEEMVVDRERATVLLVARPWDDSPELRWAVDAKLGVVKEGWLIPLATTAPGLLQEFERDFEDND